jgi:uncharacterized membrane protein
MAQKLLVPEIAVIKMVLAAHVIETEQNSKTIRVGITQNMRLRRLILLGLAVAMALATLAPIVVLAG